MKYFTISYTVSPRSIRGVDMALKRRFPIGFIRARTGTGGRRCRVRLIGYWIDKHYGSEPWGMIVGLTLGLVGGMYNFVRQSLQATREAKLSDDSRQQETGSNEGGGEG